MKLYFGTVRDPLAPGGQRARRDHWQVHVLDIHEDEVMSSVFNRADLYFGQDCKPLNPRHDLVNHSPDGFSWGYGGSGPAQLALALVADATGDDTSAMNVYQRFKRAYVSRLPQNHPWVMCDATVRALAARLLVGND